MIGFGIATGFKDFQTKKSYSGQCSILVGFLKALIFLKWESRRKQTAGGGSWLSPPSTVT